MKPLLLILLLVAPSAMGQTWICAPAKATSDARSLTLSSSYTAADAGFDFKMPPSSIDSSACSSGKPFFFSAPLPEGNYEVTLVLGSQHKTATAVKAEARRVMLMPVSVPAGGSRTERFTVNIRSPEIPGGSAVKRKPRELNSLRWDEKLTLEFTGDYPSVRSISIYPAPPQTPTIYLSGDSTVVDQEKEPWAAWGQILPAFFGPGIAVANHAESGETIKSFVGEQRFTKIFSTIKQGDYLFLQFAHNDQKEGTGYVPPATYADLLRKYVAMAREKEATPVLVTSMNRRTFDPSGHITDTLAPYPQITRQVAESEHVAMIDLNAMSKTLYEAIGEADSRSLFVYAPANTYPGQTEALHDDTHFNAYGAFELARCVVLGLQQLNLPLVRYLRDPHSGFNPSHADPAAKVAIPATAFFEVEKPYER